MSYLTAIVMGLIQGIAEFLPISSSGHLAIFQNFFGMSDIEHDYMLFDVLLHLGTLIAVLSPIGEILSLWSKSFSPWCTCAGCRPVSIRTTRLDG